MKPFDEITFEDLLPMKSGEVIADWYEDGVRCLMLRGTASMTMYVGIPETHPLAGHSYDDLPIDCHGGLTFGAKGGGSDTFRPEGFFWYGWDYGHAGDMFLYDIDPKYMAIMNETTLPDWKKDDVKWTPAMVKKDSWSALYEFKRLVKLAEAIAARDGSDPSGG